MSFAFLVPAALGLLGLALGPVLAHLTRQAIRDQRLFGATLLLDRLVSRLERRRQLADRALLMLRILVVGLVLLAAAQPELRWPQTRSELGGTGRVIIVLDNSMSMDQRGLADGGFDSSRSAYDLARAAAVAAVGELPSGTRVAAVLTAPAAVLAPLTAGSSSEAASVAALLGSASRTDGAGDLHAAMVLVRSMMQGEPAEVVVYTDESGPGQVAACEEDVQRILAVGGALVPRVYAPASPSNIAVTDATYGEGLEGGTIRVSLVSYGAKAREVTTTLTLPGDGEGKTSALTSFVTVPAMTEAGPGMTEVQFTVPRQVEGGVARVTVDDADLPADNVRVFHLPRIGASRVLVIDGDPGSTPTRSETYFLERALAPTGLARPAVDVIAPAGIAVLDPSVHRVVWMANVADPAPLVPRLAEFVRKGGGLVLGMGENVAVDRYNAAMDALLPLALRKVRDLVDSGGAEGAPLGAAERSDLLSPFDRTPGAFSRVHARRVMTVEAPVGAESEVLLRWEGGLPALARRHVGSGQVLLWTSTLDLGWGNFPVEAVFPAFVERVTSVLGGQTAGDGAAVTGIVGEPVSVPVAADAPELELSGPDGKLRAAERSGTTLHFVPDAVGAWRVSIGDADRVAAVAVNTPVAESDVRHDGSIAARQAALAPDRMMARFSLGAMVVAVAAGLLVAATVWAARPVPDPVAGLGGDDASA